MAELDWTIDPHYLSGLGCDLGAGDGGSAA
jgi:hypothetical protein